MTTIREAVAAASASNARRQALRSIGDEQLEQLEKLEQQPAAVDSEAIAIRVAELIDRQQQQCQAERPPAATPLVGSSPLKSRDVAKALERLPLAVANAMQTEFARADEAIDRDEQHRQIQVAIAEIQTAEPSKLAKLLLKHKLLEGLCWRSRRCSRPTKKLEAMIGRIRRKESPARPSTRAAAAAEADAGDDDNHREQEIAVRDFAGRGEGVTVRSRPHAAASPEAKAAKVLSAARRGSSSRDVRRINRIANLSGRGQQEAVDFWMAHPELQEGIE